MSTVQQTNFFYMNNEWIGKPHIMKLYPKGYIYIFTSLKATKRDFDLNFFIYFKVHWEVSIFIG